MPVTVSDIGPRHVLLGDPTTALGADMIALGVVRNVTLRRQTRIKTGSTVTGNENHEAKSYLGTNLEIVVDFPSSKATDIRTYLTEIFDANGDYPTLGASTAKVTMALVHPDDAASTSAGASAKTRWIPSVRVSDLGEEAFNANEDGMDERDFIPVTFQAGYIATDQDGSDVPEAALPDFHGDRLSAHGMGYLLPTPYGPAE